MIVNEAKTCRICSGKIKTIADLGYLYINDFPEAPGISKGTAPVVIDQCTECTLVQLRHTVDPDILYGEHYWYQSGLNPKLKQNLLDIANKVNELTKEGDIVLDIGANDGTLLSGINKSRLRIGCEPAPNLQESLKENTDIVIPNMWNYRYMEGKVAQVITAIGMFYDMDDPNDFISSVQKSLSKTGIFIAQLMTLAPMLRMCDLGNICHEHLEYYTYKSLVELYERNGLEIFHVEENDIQGGSYQIWARHLNKGSIKYEEDVSGLYDFFNAVKVNGNLLKSKLTELKNNGKKCYVYGASTKGNTMLQYWDIGDCFDGAAEIHVDKIGRYTVGTDILIIEESTARKLADVFFVPNFGFKDLFLQKEKTWIKNGGTMIFAMPQLEVINNEDSDSSGS